MPRKRKKPPAWEGFRPGEGKYWMLGGPWVPPEEIEPEPGHKAENIRPFEKPATRLKSVLKLLDEAETQLAKALAYYLDLHERGVEALEWDWEREQMRNRNPARTAPDGFDYALSHSYDSIARQRALLVVYREVIDGIEPSMLPLFRRKPADS